MSRVIEVDRLRKTFGSFVAVDDVSFEVPRGEIFGYLGANGAGKSTTIRMLCGLLPPTSGRAVVAGQSIADAPLAVKRSIGYMSQKFSLYLDLSARHNLEFFGGIYGLGGRRLKGAVDAAVEQTGLRPYLDAPVTSLPGGIRQRLALACALLHAPPIVFLDEPTAGVDPDARRDFWTLIREMARDGRTIFVTTHYMDEAEYCARIGLMVDGRLVALDAPKKLKEEHVPGTVVAVEGGPFSEALERVRALPGVVAAQPFGARLHVRFAVGRENREALEMALQSAGARVERLDAVDATLEDVFLEVVGRSAASAKEVVA